MGPVHQHAPIRENRSADGRARAAVASSTRGEPAPTEGPTPERFASTGPSFRLPRRAARASSRRPALQPRARALRHSRRH
ncbi:MAG: hypothetical protein AMJ62_16350 [Myxococcales bacterium SG8_38]|nr:MAG: hypothetical protein AMJ62_16350 [Myxococcales bacterium SG8_38]